MLKLVQFILYKNHFVTPISDTAKHLIKNFKSYSRDGKFHMTLVIERRLRCNKISA